MTPGQPPGQQPPAAPARSPAVPSDGATEGAPAAHAPACSACDLDILLACSDSVFGILDPSDGRILYVSPSASHVFGISPEEFLLGRNTADVVHADDRERAWAVVTRARAGALDAPPARAELRLADARAPDGSPVWVDVALIFDGEYIFGVARNSSCDKRTEETLRAFLLVTSHDLRTPCHGMSCASQLLAARPCVARDAETLQLLREVRASCALMLSTVNDVLELKRLEDDAALGRAGGAHKREAVDVRTLFGECLDVCRVACSKPIAWANEAAPLPAALQGDAERLQQLLLNLAVAAVRAAAADGDVSAELFAEPAPGGVTQLRAVLRAHGAALSAAALRRAFDPSTPGCQGLALLVARASARATGGDVTLANERGALRLEARVLLLAEGAAACDAAEDAGAAAASAPPPPPPPEAWMAGLLTDAAARQSRPGRPASPRAPPPPPPRAPLPPVSPALVQRMFSFLVGHLDAVFTCASYDDAGNLIYVYASPSLERMYGWKAEQFVGHKALEFAHEEDVAGELGAVLRAGAACPARKPFTVKRRLLLPDGSFTWLLCTGCTEGRCVYAVCSDHHEQVAKEAALRALLLSVSRELREPANAILTASALLARRAAVADDAEAAFCVQALGASSCLLLGLITNVLSMRRMQSGTLELHSALFDPGAALRDVLQVCRVACACGLRSELAPLPAAVEADKTFLGQILQNLVTNAARFEQGRGVVVAARCLAGGAPGAPAATHALEVSVTDRGQGLSAEECSAVFEPYVAAPQSGGGGTGLGLFIARACARRAGGDVKVASEPGRGACFTLRLPVRVPDAAAAAWAAEMAAAAAAPGAESSASAEPSPRPAERKRSLDAPAAAPGPRLRCLVADDHGLNRLLVAKLASQHGFDVATAVDGADALAQLVAAFVAGAPPHIALIDMQMPVMSGPEATRAFRRWEREHCAGAPRLPVVALTANVLEQHQAECEAAGMDRFVSKPLRGDTFAQLALLAAAYAAQTAAHASRKARRQDTADDA